MSDTRCRPAPRFKAFTPLLEARTLIPLLCAAFLFAALCPPARAEAREAKPGSLEAPETSPDKKKEKPKKKRKKLTQAKAVSEYKFIAADPTPSYRFDKKGDPILKRGKYAKAAKGGGKKSLPKSSKAAGQSAIPKLKAAANPGAARYVCPMGDYEGDKPGQCPKCGMTLVEKK